MKRAFSIIELTIVIVILGIVAALAIPRFTHAAPPPKKALRQSLTVLRTAIERYHDQHDAYPGQQSPNDSTVPAGAEAFILQLTKFTNRDGHTSDVRNEVYRFGPYLTGGIPECPVVADREAARRLHVVQGDSRPGFIANVSAGWVVNIDTGDIAANTDLVDAQGLRLDRY
ncbi:MAG: type II secretion system protein [Phycisphaerae bacterium]